MNSGELVTFAVFCYNQEAFVKDAVEAAFCQTYEPLQIILSDDNSTDATFAIISALAAQYGGPHTIVVRQNQPNQGLIGHVNTIFEISDGELIVVAAGDDISMPERTEELYRHYVRHGRPALMHSKALVIDEHGALSDVIAPPPALRRDISVAEASVSSSLYLGASGAWKKSLFRNYGPIRNLDTFEDLTLGFRAALDGGTAFVDKELLYYRVFSRSLSSGADKKGLRLDQLMINTLTQRKADLLKSGNDNTLKISKKIDKEIAVWRMKSVMHGGGRSIAWIAMKNPMAFVSVILSAALHRWRRT